MPLAGPFTGRSSSEVVDSCDFGDRCSVVGTASEVISVASDAEVCAKGVSSNIDWKLKAMFCVIGCVALLGWNFILGELGTLIDAFGEAYGTWCSLCFALCINAGQLMLVWIGNRFRFGPRFYAGCIGMGVSMILIAVSAMTFARNNQSAGLAAGCIFVGFYGFANAVMESTMFGLAALVGPVSMQFILIGEGVSGLIAWPLDRLCQAILEGCGVADYTYPRMMLFFGLGMLVNFASVPMYKYSMQRHPVIVKALEIEEGRQDFILKKETTRPLVKILCDVAPQSLTVWFSFTISYTVFPWTVFEMSPSALSPTSFGKLMTYCYQVCDTVGRASPSYHLRLKRWFTPYAAAGRLIFIPLFFLCIHLSFSPFTQDWFRFVIMALLGLTNGILAASCMIHGPTQVDQNEKEELEIAGYAMSFGLICGILTGSVIATVIKQSAYM